LFVVEVCKEFGKDFFIKKNNKCKMRYKIILSVKDIQGNCPLYEVGDKIVIEHFYIESSLSQNICLHAFSAMLSLLSAFSHGVSAKELGIGPEENIGYLQCPDPGAPYTGGGRVLFELRREALNE
jgi:uncharacterized repeat protein (TIGR04076 family)